MQAAVGTGGWALDEWDEDAETEAQPSIGDALTDIDPGATDGGLEFALTSLEHVDSVARGERASPSVAAGLGRELGPHTATRLVPRLMEIAATASDQQARRTAALLLAEAEPGVLSDRDTGWLISWISAYGDQELRARVAHGRVWRPITDAEGRGTGAWSLPDDGSVLIRTRDGDRFEVDARGVADITPEVARRVLSSSAGWRALREAWLRSGAPEGVTVRELSRVATDRTTPRHLRAVAGWGVLHFARLLPPRAGQPVFRPFERLDLVRIDRPPRPLLGDDAVIGEVSWHDASPEGGMAWVTDTLYASGQSVCTAERSEGRTAVEIDDGHRQQRVTYAADGEVLRSESSSVRVGPLLGALLGAGMPQAVVVGVGKQALLGLFDENQVGCRVRRTVTATAAGLLPCDVEAGLAEAGTLQEERLRWTAVDDVGAPRAQLSRVRREIARRISVSYVLETTGPFGWREDVIS